MVVLRLFTTTLKNLATELGVFVLTSTQISNDDDKAGGFRDYRNIRGSAFGLNIPFPILLMGVKFFKNLANEEI